jgi:hypothetical protein
MRFSAKVSDEISFATTILLLQLYKIVAMRSLVRVSGQVSRDVSSDVPDKLFCTTITQLFFAIYEISGVAVFFFG